MRRAVDWLVVFIYAESTNIMTLKFGVAFCICLLLCCPEVKARHLEMADDNKYGVLLFWLRVHSRPIVPFTKSCREFISLLSIDGGGLRGIITTRILMAISDEIKTHLVGQQYLLLDINDTFHYDHITDFHIDLADYFDAIAAVSDGSWIATYIASKGGLKTCRRLFRERHIVRKYGLIRPGSLEGLEVFYLEYGPTFYPYRIPSALVRPQYWGLPFGKRGPRIPMLTSPRHSAAGLEYALDRFLGDVKLSEVYTSLLIVAFDLNTRSVVQLVHDRVVPLTITVASSFVMICSRRLKASTERLERLTADANATNCDDVELAIIEADRIDADCGKYLNKSKQLWNTDRLVSVSGRTRLGQITSDIYRRDPDDWKDYLDVGMRFTDGVDFYLKDVARCSSAFPSIFDAKRLVSIQSNGTSDMIIDAAIVGNNPTMQAWNWLWSKTSIAIADVITLSIGTGTAKQKLDHLEQAGPVQWASHILSIILDDSSEYQQSAMNALFYTYRAITRKYTMSFRIQEKRDPSSEQGDILRHPHSPEYLEALKQMGIEVAFRHRWNIQKFVDTYLFGICSLSKEDLEKGMRPKKKFARRDYILFGSYLSSARTAKQEARAICPA